MSKSEFVSATVQKEGIFNGVTFTHTKKVVLPKSREEELPGLLNQEFGPPTKGASENAIAVEAGGAGAFSILPQSIISGGSSLVSVARSVLQSTIGKLVVRENPYGVRISTEYKNEDGDDVQDSVEVGFSTMEQAEEYVKNWSKDPRAKQEHKVFIYEKKNLNPDL